MAVLAPFETGVERLVDWEGGVLIGGEKKNEEVNGLRSLLSSNIGNTGKARKRLFHGFRGFRGSGIPDCLFR